MPPNRLRPSEISANSGGGLWSIGVPAVVKSLKLKGGAQPGGSSRTLEAFSVVMAFKGWRLWGAALAFRGRR